MSTTNRYVPSSTMTSLRKKSKKNKMSLEDRREKNRQKVLSISFMFPTVEIDVIISALMEAKGNIEEAILMVSKFEETSKPNECLISDDGGESVEIEEICQLDEDGNEQIYACEDEEEEEEEENGNDVGDTMLHIQHSEDDGNNLTKIIEDHDHGQCILLDHDSIGKGVNIYSDFDSQFDSIGWEGVQFSSSSATEQSTSTKIEKQTSSELLLSLNNNNAGVTRAELKEQVLEDTSSLKTSSYSSTTLNRLTDFFPSLSELIIREALDKNHGDEDDTCAYIVAKYMEEEEEDNDWEMIEDSETKTTIFQGGWQLIDDYMADEYQQVMDGSSLFASYSATTESTSNNMPIEEGDLESDVSYDSGDEGEEEEEDDENTEELEVLDTANFSWFHEAKEKQNAFMSLQEEQDEALARLLQEQEFMKLEQMIVHDEKNINKHFSSSWAEHKNRSILSSASSSSSSHTANLHGLESRPVGNYKRFDPETFWMSYEKNIRRKINNVRRIENIVQSSLLERFKNYCQRAEDPVILMAFHGTRQSNIDSIKANGLLVPGRNNNIGIANGSALGVGIYVSLNASTAISYCYGGNKLIVCAVAVGRKCITTRCGEVIVSFNEAQVLPCWVVTFENPYRIATSSLPRVSQTRIRPITTQTKPTPPPFLLTQIPKRLRAKNKDKVLTKKERKEKKKNQKQKLLFKRGLLKPQ